MASKIKTKDCPQCKKSATGTKAIREVFGFRNTSNEGSQYFMVPHSWCAECRGAQPRPSKAKLELPNTLAGLRREYKARFPLSRTRLAGASFYKAKLLETGNYKE